MIGAERNDSYLLCRIGSRIGALAIRDVGETMRPLPVEPLVTAPPFVLGLAIVRGVPVPVVDARRILDPSAVSSRLSFARFVSLKLGERIAALAVDAVLDVRSFEEGVLADIPPLLGGADADLVSSIAAVDARLLLVLEASRLIPDSVWNSIESRGTTE